VVAVSSARVTMGVASGIYLFGFHHRWLRPRPSAIGMETFRRLADLGGKYVITQLSGLAVTQSAPIIITQLLGPSQVFVFVVASRLLQLPFTVSYLATAPLVSAYGEAQSRGDWDWLWNTWQRSFNIAAFGGGLLIVLLAITAQKVILLWAGPLAVPSPPLIFWLSVYGFFGVVISPVSNLLLGVQRVAAQARINSVTAVANIAFAVFFGRIYGLPGVAMAMALSLVVINGIGQYREVWEFRATAARAEPVLDI